MRKFLKLLIYLLFIVLWLIVILLSLELFERFRWKYIEKTNKFVKMRKGELLLAEWDPDSSPESVQYGEGKDILSPEDLLVGEEFCLPLQSSFEKWTYRLSYYLSSNHFVGKCIETIYGFSECEISINDEKLSIERLDFKENLPPGRKERLRELILKVNLGMLERNKLVENVYDEDENRRYIIYFYPGGKQGENSLYRCFVIPTTPSDLWMSSSGEEVSSMDIYDIPYFIYLPHQSSTKNSFRTNNFGFRDYDFIIPKPKGNVRILCIGASTTEEGVSNKETYPKFLEEILRNYFSTDKIEVFNCGISGMTLRKHVAKLPEYLLLEADIVVIYEGVNDLVYEVFTRAYHNLPSPKKKLINNFYIFNYLLRTWGPFSYSKSDLYRDIKENMLTHLEILIGELSKKVKIIALSSVGVPVRSSLSREEVEYMEYYYRKEWGGIYSTFQQYCEMMDLWNKLLKSLCEREGIIYVPFAESVPSSVRYFGDICHLRQKGIKLKAEVMAKALIPAVEELLKSRENL
ncbi:MAG: SGNH/GDSL hydrolase family protein [Candidatus Hydrogenedentes bacterium]|nr:SGNH/GDSL hydrolase family protein [Candidatus Hydrogenedentota bacterium]